MSIELSLEDVKRIALHYGFEFEVISFDLDNINTPSFMQLTNHIHITLS
jgi:hypothetical protein